MWQHSYTPQNFSKAAEVCYKGLSTYYKNRFFMKVKSCCSLFILFYNKSRDLNILKTSLFKKKSKNFFLVSIFPLTLQGESLLEQLYFAWIET